jgi:ligand-binding sensor domain-containing protein/signal transduction histidine kinase
LRSSNISRKRAPGSLRIFRWLVTGLLSTCVVASAYALNPGSAMSQYVSDSWGIENGFPGGAVRAIVQTTDGYLWIGAEEGLVRFDGQHFQMLRYPKDSLPIRNILGLATDGGTGLWIWLPNSRVVHYSNGGFESEQTEAKLTPFSIATMSVVKTGGFLLAGLTGEIQRYSSRGVEDVASISVEGHPMMISMAEMPDKRLWVGTRDSGLFYLNNGQPTFVTKGLPDAKINSLLAVSDHDLWVGTDNGVVRWNGTELTSANVPGALSHVQALTMIADRDANVWIGTPSGLFRVNPHGVALTKEPGNSPIGVVSALFEDREGDLWVGGAEGIARLRDSVFTTYSSSQGLPSNKIGPVYGDADGRTWFAPTEGGLYWMQNGKMEEVSKAGLNKDVVYSITGGKGELWVGRQLGGLTHLRYQEDLLIAQTYTHASGLAQDSVYSVHQSRDGAVWAGTLSGGTSVFRDGKFTTFTVADGLLSNTVTAMEDSSDGTMWFATPNGLSAMSDGHWKNYVDRDGLPSRDVHCLLNDSKGVLWIGTSAGLAFLRSGRIQVPPTFLESLHKAIFGVAEDREGWLWIAAFNDVLRVNRDKLLSGTLTDSDVREYGVADGLHSIEGTQRDRSVIADPQGRIWFSMTHGLSVADPARMKEEMAPALVRIEGISANGSPVDMSGVPHIPGARNRIAFNYTGLNLSAPERVRFRYKLDGFDRDWSEPVAVREAAYTNLSPGMYQFHVMATDTAGQWNGSEAVTRFEIEPAMWQTWWYRLLCLLGLGCVVLAIYRLRMHELTKQLNIRFEERLAERTRIAQELHDTLLQGCLSASLQLHVAIGQLPADSPAKPLLGRVLQLMGQVVDEGRNALLGLRSPEKKIDDLEEAFSRISEELSVQDEVKYRVIVSNTSRPVHPEIRDEVYRIGREAVVNAFRHARANSIEVEIEYASDYLLVLIQDDGCGIDPEILRLGREGHWGLSGMRERAEGLGARLKVGPRAKGGTEVELFVPGTIAFLSQGSTRESRRRIKLYSKKIELPKFKR